MRFASFLFAFLGFGTRFFFLIDETPYSFVHILNVSSKRPIVASNPSHCLLLSLFRTQRVAISFMVKEQQRDEDDGANNHGNVIIHELDGCYNALWLRESQDVQGWVKAFRIHAHWVLG